METPHKHMKGLTMTRKNYGIMGYTKNHKKPSPQNCVRYLADLFDIKDNTKIEQILEKEFNIKDVYERGITAETVKAVFLEKQLEKHNRARLCPEVNLTPYTDNTIRGIIKSYYQELDRIRKNRENQENKTADERIKANNEYWGFHHKNNEARDKYNKVLKQDKKQQQKSSTNNNQQPALTQADLNKMVAESKQSLPDDMQFLKSYLDDDYTKYSVQDIESHAQCDNVLPMQGQGRHETMARLKTDKQGKYESVGLHKALTKILDDILGQTEIRSVERGYSRPSRFSHFVKGCFLPVYKSNKPRKKPAFFIDSSGSMGIRRGHFNCITSAIGAFLRVHHRRISELRPKYYAFAGGFQVQEIDIKNQLPIACGGTSTRFLCNVKNNEKSIIITDAEFENYELAELRLWATNHRTADIHWITNNKTHAERLKGALTGFGNQKVHYAEF